MKETFRWVSPRLEKEIKLVRWGETGTPLLLFPTAGGDAEEIERFRLLKALEPMISSGRLKVYSTDSVPGKAWISRQHSPEHCSWLQNLFDSVVYWEIVPLIRADCHSDDIEIITAGASIGAFNAVASLCRHPDVFKLAIGMSGTYDLTKYLGGSFNQDFYFSSPLHFLPGLDGEALQQLRNRKILLPCGQGDYENIDQSWWLASVLGDKGVPNRVEPWGRQWHHNWVTWREMLPRYLAEHA